MAKTRMGITERDNIVQIKNLREYYNNNHVLRIVGESSVIRRMFLPFNAVSGNGEGILIFKKDGVYGFIQDIIRAFGCVFHISNESFIDYEFNVPDDAEEIRVGLYTKDVVANIPDSDTEICSIYLNVEEMSFDVQIGNFIEKNRLIDPKTILTHVDGLDGFVNRIIDTLLSSIDVAGQDISKAIDMMKVSDIYVEYDGEMNNLVFFGETTIKKSEYILGQEYIVNTNNVTSQGIYSNDYLKSLSSLIKSFGDYIDDISIDYMTNKPMIVNFNLSGDNQLKLLIAPIIPPNDISRQPVGEEKIDKSALIAEAKKRQPVVKKVLGGRKNMESSVEGDGE